MPRRKRDPAAWASTRSPLKSCPVMVELLLTSDHPDRLTLRPHEVTAEGDRIRITLPAMSVATVTVQVA